MHDIIIIKATLISMFLLLLVELPFASGLKCYHCNSTYDVNCKEMWDEELPENEQKLITCNLEDAAYCIKVTGIWGGVVGTQRFCHSRDLDNKCQEVYFPEHDRFYDSCVYTCFVDECNSSSKLSLHFILYTMILSVCGTLAWRVKW